MNLKFSDSCMLCSQDVSIYVVKKIEYNNDTICLGFCSDHATVNYYGLKEVFEDEQTISFEDLKKLYGYEEPSSELDT